MMDMEMNAELERDGASDTGEASSEGSSAASVYCTLEQDFARITSEAKRNEALADFGAEYARLFEALYRSRQLEQELGRKCELLAEELLGARARAEGLEAQAARDAASLGQLAGQLAGSKELADAAHTREQAAQQVVEGLRLSLARLGAERRAGASPEPSRRPRQRPESAAGPELEALRQRLESVSGQRRELEARLAEAERGASELRDELDRQAGELARERRERDRADSELRTLHRELGLRHSELQAAEEALSAATEGAAKLEGLLAERTLRVERGRRESEALLAAQASARAEAAGLRARADEQARQLLDKEASLKGMAEELRGMKAELAKLKSQGGASERRLAKEARLRLEGEEAARRAAAVQRAGELEAAELRRQLELERQAVERLGRDREAAARNSRALEDARGQLSLEVAGLEAANRRLETGLEELTAELGQTRRDLAGAERDRDRRALEARELAQQVEDCAAQARLERREASDGRKRLAEAEAQLRQQRALCEAVRSERDGCRRGLERSQAELAEARSRARDADRQAARLAEQLDAKEAALGERDSLASKAEREKAALRAELASCRRDVSELRREAEGLRAEERRRRAELREAGAALGRGRGELGAALAERDALGGQLVRRNDELALLRSQLRLRGEARAEVRGGPRAASETADAGAAPRPRERLAELRELRAQVFQLERQLARERLKVAALEDQLQSPVNVHRWRRLEGTDPDTFDLLRKLQLLQKRVLNMSSEMLDKERRIEETEKLYVDLRATLAKQPGPEVFARLGKTRRALRARGKKMKCLIAELNMNLSAEHKFEIEKVKRELHLVKVKYLAQNKQKPQKPQKQRGKAIVDDSSIEKSPTIDPLTVMSK